MKSILKTAGIMIVIPLAAYAVFFLLCLSRGISGFGLGNDTSVILTNTVYSGLIALAVSYNLTSGRFDFSVGATLLVSTALGSSIALRIGGGPVVMLLLCLVFGAIFGGIGGLAYVTLKLPPMVVSLGVAMIYEAICFMATGGSGVSLIGKSNLLIWARQPFVFLLLIGIVAVLYILLNRTKFGYHCNALRSDQEIAVNMGINEISNTLICYVIAGVCLAAAGVVNMSVIGTVSPELGLGSVSYIQNAFMPMFIGNLLGRYFDRNTGVVIGALTQSIIFAGIGKLGIPSAWQSVITSLIVLCFFAYSYNSYKIVEFEMFRKKKAKAMEALAGAEKTAV